MRRRLATVTLLIIVLGALALAPGASAAPLQADGAGVWHTVRWGDTLYRLARQYGVTVNAIVAANGLTNLNRIYVGQRLLIPTGTSPAPSCSYQRYVVQRGDTLYSISRRFGISVWSLARANQLLNPNLIYAGQRLIITASGLTIDTPASGAVIDGSVHVSGTGSGFENTVVVDLLAADGTLIVRKSATIVADVGQVGPYAVDLTFTPPPTTRPGRIVVWREDASDGSVAARTCVDVVLQGSGS